MPGRQTHGVVRDEVLVRPERRLLGTTQRVAHSADVAQEAAPEAWLRRDAIGAAAQGWLRGAALAAATANAAEPGESPHELAPALPAPPRGSWLAAAKVCDHHAPAHHRGLCDTLSASGKPSACLVPRLRGERGHRDIVVLLIILLPSWLVTAGIRARVVFAGKAYLLILLRLLPLAAWSSLARCLLRGGSAAALVVVRWRSGGRCGEDGVVLPSGLRQQLGVALLDRADRGPAQRRCTRSRGLR